MSRTSQHSCHTGESPSVLASDSHRCRGCPVGRQAGISVRKLRIAGWFLSNIYIYMSNEVRPSAILVKAQKGRREGHGQKYTCTHICARIFICTYAHRMAVSVIRMIVGAANDAYRSKHRLGIYLTASYSS